MGLFDDVHTGTRCGQTKAFDKSLNSYELGSYVPAPVSSCQIAMNPGWLQIRNYFIDDWTDIPAANIPTFDYFGTHIREGEPLISEPFWVPDPTSRGTETESEQLLAKVANVATLHELDPTSVEYAERLAYLERTYDYKAAVALALPYNCKTCARIQAERA
jgi:hypothetical protein